MDGSFSAETGTCQANSADNTVTSAATMDLTLIEAQVKSGEAAPPLILFPQTVSGTVKLEIYDRHNQYFVCPLTIPDNELLTGINYTYTITVNKTGLQVTGATLTDWIEENEIKSEASSADE